ncbi:MAG: hypothetical protein CSA44_00850 [Gammaproteobacteria bacterium]|nr:MAG: hypothetical protein CSA44_00850 [Gammaproteobacteria bacterium]
MKKQLQNITVLGSALLISACVNAQTPSNDTIILSDCAIQESIPGAKATGAFLTVKKADDAPLSIVAAKAPDVTDHVEIHEMLMQDNKMVMSQIEAYPLQKGDNIFKKGGYHIMLMDMQKKLTAGEHYDITLVFSDGSEKSCNAVVKTVKALTPKHMKKNTMKPMQEMQKASH